MSTDSESNELLKSTKVFDVSHVTAVVTGAASGIGLMMSQVLVSNGAKVYICDIDGQALDTVMSIYNTGPGQLIPHVVDVSDKAAIVAFAAAVNDVEGDRGIQFLVNNAGIARDTKTEFAGNGEPDWSDPSAISDHFLRSEPHSWTEMLQTNVTGVFFMCMAFLPLLARGHEVIPGHSSSILNVASNSAFLKDTTRGHIGYSAIKASTAHLSRMLALAFAKTGVRVNILAPGTFPTVMTTGTAGINRKSTLQRKVNNIPGRPGSEQDIAGVILLLASRGGDFFNHQILFPDGGETLQNPATV